MQLREYQQNAVDSVYYAWENGERSTLVVSPTGTGKTVIFSAIAGRAIAKNERVLMLVDRTVLVSQSRNAFHKWLGVHADIEQADMSASTNHYMQSEIVIATVQTLRSGRGSRKEKFKPEDFDVLIIDEAHLSITKSTIETIEYFQQNPKLRTVGATATPERADKTSLRALFGHCAFQYGIRQATHDGWLVPVKASIVHIDALNLVSKGKSDWSNRQIGEYMEANDVILATATAVIEQTGDMKTLVYCARVSHATAVSRRINQIEPNTAAVIHGKTPKHERTHILREFAEGRINRLINHGVLTTGYDEPTVEAIVNARPTKSKSLFTQIVGRGLRTLPGITDGLQEPHERRAAIAASDKPHCRVISLMGRESCHDLVSPVDVLAGKDFDPARVDRAKEMLDEGMTDDPDEALIMAEDEYEQMLDQLEDAPVSVRLQYRTEDIDLYTEGEYRAALTRNADIPVQREVQFLLKAGFSITEMRGWPGAMVKSAIEEVRRRHDMGLATKKQCNMLKKFGYTDIARREMSKMKAQQIISKVCYGGGR
jgi:superfamily II DNA or RNA helicase